MTMTMMKMTMMRKMTMIRKMTLPRLKNFFEWFSPVHPISTTHFVTTNCWMTIRTGIVPFVRLVTSGELGTATSATNVSDLTCWFRNASRKLIFFVSIFFF